MLAAAPILIHGAQETMNYWKQLPHIMKYFRTEEDPTARLPKNFMSGFLEVSIAGQDEGTSEPLTYTFRDETELPVFKSPCAVVCT